MKKELRSLSALSILVILLLSTALTACKPKDEDTPADSLIKPPDFAIASQVAGPLASHFTFPLASQFVYPFGKQFKYPFGSQFTYPFGNQYAFPFGSQFAYPLGSQFAYPLGSQFAYPLPSQIATLWIHPELLRVRFIRIPPGWFLLGSDGEKDPLARGDEVPQTDAHQPGFWMSQGEITNKEYALCVETGVCSVPALRPAGPTNHFGDPAYDDHPVVGVDWYQAQGYCEWIQGRLPTEAEWEKSAGGAASLIYPWGNDAPACDRANGILDGCSASGNTKPIGSYPLGISPYGLFDMAGNVREWTQDWYTADAYLNASQFEPSGPDKGDKKVVRGGGFNDFQENLRTASRWAYEPERDFDDVGFRCVPETRSYATFCEPSYVPLCYDPEIPSRDEPCQPGQNTPGEEGVTLLGFGCPMNKTVCFEVNTNGGGTTGYTAKVDADGFTCRALDERPDIIQCCGPEQPMERNVQITICAPGASPDGTVIETSALNETAGVKLASIVASGAVSLMRTTAPTCPDGYMYDENSGACVLDPSQPSCPAGTRFEERMQGCVPTQEDCPQGYLLTESGICEPGAEIIGMCLPGYFYNTAINCCEPAERGNFGCPQNYYWNASYGRCIPMDAYNCPLGTAYNGYGECDVEPFTAAPDAAPQGECPPGMLTAAANSCEPADMGDEGGEGAPRPGDLTTPDGQILPASTSLSAPQCPSGYYYDAKYESCVQRDENGCPSGYYYDTGLAQCVPTNGPSSPCPVGFVYNARTECCTPEPGTDGTNCPNDTATAPGTLNMTQGYTPFAAANFDPQTGACVGDGQGTEATANCPPATYAAAVGTCDQYPADGETIPSDLCREWEYFDPQLGYCVPLMADCCPIGQDYSAISGECMDVLTKPRDGECSDGFELIDGLCWLIGRTEGTGGMCWTITRNTPKCYGPCEVGLIYNALTGRCEKPAEPEDPCEDVNCAGLSYEQCNANNNCCAWDRKNSCYKK